MVNFRKLKDVTRSEIRTRDELVAASDTDH